MRPLFTADWPCYAIAAHISFWAASALMVASGLAALAGLTHPQFFILFLYMWVLAGFGLGISTVFSAKLYVGNQVFARGPTTGWPARLIGVVLSAAIGFLMLFAYAITGMHG